MRTLRWALVVFGAAAPLVASVSCGSDFSDCSATNSCSPGAEAGAAGAANAGGAQNGQSGATDGATSGNGVGAAGAGAASSGGSSGGTCDDDGASPAERACLVDEDFAVFVAPSGDDADGDGSRENPFATIGRGLTGAVEAEKSHIIACNGEYAESVVIDEDTDGLSLHGGFACPGEDDEWTYVEGTRASVKPDDPGYGLHVSGLSDGLIVEDVEVTAQDAEDAGASSIAVFVSEADNVVFRRVKFTAGKGMDGESGVTTEVGYDLLSTLAGSDASGDTGGPFKLCACDAGGTTTGAAGGTGGGGALGGGDGLPDRGGGLGSTVSQCLNSNQNGGNGLAGAPGEQGPGAISFGSVATDGWTPRRGETADPGGPGQGGGGGGGATAGGGGGGGGCGGCGGAEGTGGGGGGASMALLVLESTVTLEASELNSDDAGDGGGGSSGQEGQPAGGTGGDRDGSACNGGNGGPGGDGGPGGGGAGGISAGIVFAGDEPTVTDTNIEFGNAGDSGIGFGADNHGIEGDAAEIIPI